jgi:phosphatidylglycerophosphate synthase
MVDRFLLPWLAAPHRWAARALLRAEFSANAVTLIGAAIGLAALPLIAMQRYGWALALILINRFMDGVDGTMARTGTAGPTDRGAFLDSVCDFLFYAAVPLGFALADPPQNALPAAVLLASFIGTATTFLAFAAAAAKRGMVSPTYPNKGFYYLGGLTEGTETILLFCAMCLWPQHFAWLAYGFAAACAVTTATRLYFGMRSL